MTGRWWITCVAAVIGWIGLGVGPGFAAPIPPVTATPQDAPAITLSVLDNSVDVADTYLPSVTVDAAGTVTGKTVTLQVNGVSSATIALLNSTTAWPGTCTNFSAPRMANAESSDTFADGTPGTPKPDFTLVGAQLTSWDCGGTAVIQVSSGANIYTFKLPQDANNNFIADSFEAAFGGDPAGADPDADGHSNFDEYRGFIVSRALVRGDPLKKDLFVFLVNPQSAGSVSLPAGGSLVGKLPSETRTVYPTDGTALTADIDQLATVARVHLIGQKRDLAGALIFDGTNKNTDEMIDRLASFSIVSGRETWVYRTTDAPAPTVTVNSRNRRDTPADDRVVNKNRRFGDAQKAVRIIESLDASRSSPIGSSSWGSPNALNEAIIYTQRIVDYINNTAPTTPGTRIHYATHDGVAWGAYTEVDRPFIISKMIQFVLAHEAGGHDTRLTTTASTLGFHDPTGTGGMMDSQVEVITTGTPDGIKFRIPSLYLSGHLSGVHVAP